MDIKVLLISLLVITSSAVLWGSTTTNPKRCPPGQYLLNSSAASPCQPCPEGTFMPDYNEAAECRQLSKCKENEMSLFDGNSTGDAVCQCREGYERNYDRTGIFSGRTYFCRPCPEGKVAQRVPDSDPGDTLCCQAEDIPKRTFMIRHCMPRSPDSPPIHETIVQPSTATPDELKNCSPSTQQALAGMFGILVIGVVVYVVIIVCGRRYPQSILGPCVPPFCRANKPAGDQYITDA